ncbi:MAG: hypothetical protein JXB49_09555 [Bacteroidales bacterium]|nr:hypothetical protein [Bacteroidales bacterium]
MKTRLQITLMGIILFFSGIVYSQDLVVRENGDSLNCRITNIDENNIYVTMKVKNNYLNIRIPQITVTSYTYGFYKKKKNPNSEVIGHFALTVDPIGAITMGPSVMGEILIPLENAPVDFGILGGYRMAKLGWAANNVISDGSLDKAYTIPISIRVYILPKTHTDGLYLGHRNEFGNSFLDNGQEIKLRAFGVDLGYKWVFNNRFTLDISDTFGVIKTREMAFSETIIETAPGWYSETTYYYPESDWESIGFVAYLISIRLGYTF